MPEGTRPRSVVDGLKFGVTGTGDFPAYTPPNYLLQRNAAGNGWQNVDPTTLGAVTEWGDLSDCTGPLVANNFSQVNSLGGALEMFDLFGTANTFTATQEIQGGVNVNNNVATPTIANEGIVIGTGTTGGYITHAQGMSAVFGYVYSGGGTPSVIGQSLYGGVMLGRAVTLGAGNATVENTANGYASISALSVSAIGSSNSITRQNGSANISSAYTYSQNDVVDVNFAGKANIGAVYSSNLTTNANIDVDQTGLGCVLAAFNKPANAAGDVTVLQSGQGLLTGIYTRGRGSASSVTHNAKGGLMAAYLKRGVITASGNGASLFGKAGLNASVGNLYSTGIASSVNAFAANGTVSASADGASAIGKAGHNQLHAGNIYSSGIGSFVHVFAAKGYANASDDGAVVIGKAGSNVSGFTPGYIYSSGKGSFAQGYARDSYYINASNPGSWAVGATSPSSGIYGGIYSTADNAIQFFPGTNGDVNSIGIGESFRLFGGDTNTAKSTNGHLWRTATGSHVHAFTGGIDKNLTLVPGGTSYSTATTATVADDVFHHWSGTAFGATTTYLPATPADGHQVSVVNGDGVNTLTLDGNGNNINGAATRAVGAAFGNTVHVVYNGAAANGWWVV